MIRLAGWAFIFFASVFAAESSAIKRTGPVRTYQCVKVFGVRIKVLSKEERAADEKKLLAVLKTMDRTWRKPFVPTVQPPTEEQAVFWRMAEQLRLNEQKNPILVALPAQEVASRRKRQKNLLANYNDLLMDAHLLTELALRASGESLDGRTINMSNEERQGAWDYSIQVLSELVDTLREDKASVIPHYFDFLLPSQRTPEGFRVLAKVLTNLADVVTFQAEFERKLGQKIGKLRTLPSAVRKEIVWALEESNFQAFTIPLEPSLEERLDLLASSIDQTEGPIPGPIAQAIIRYEGMVEVFKISRVRKYYKALIGIDSLRGSGINPIGDL
jgi:hypothetical protein